MSVELEFFAILFKTDDETYQKMLDTFTTICQMKSPDRPNDLTDFVKCPVESGPIKSRFFTFRSSRDLAMSVKMILMLAYPSVPIILAQGKDLENAIEQAKKEKIAQTGQPLHQSDKDKYIQEPDYE